MQPVCWQIRVCEANLARTRPNSTAHRWMQKPVSILKEKIVEIEDILGRLRSMASPGAVAGMARYGINPKNNYGVSVGKLREIAKGVGANHELALQLWTSGIHDARILASIVDDPEAVSEQQMDSWVIDFDSWDVCDQCCNNLFSRTRFARRKAEEWSRRSEEFVKRAGFVLMAALAVHDKETSDLGFVRFLGIVESGANDNRKYVKKAVNWALRQIGKRNMELNRRAIETANRILRLESETAHWIALDALRELASADVRTRIQRKKHCPQP